MDRSEHERDSDGKWKTHIEIVSSPNPYLSSGQQTIITADFEIQDRMIAIPSLPALLKHVVIRLSLCLDDDKLKRVSKEYELTVKQKEAVNQYMIING